MSEHRKIVRLPIDEIVVPEGRRQLQPEKVKDLAGGMHELGLLHSISIRMQAGKPHLIDGHHRLNAARDLGWPDIECEIIEADERRARMIEIAANLHRAELVELERAEAITEWVRLAEEARNEISAQAEQKMGRGRPRGGLSAAAREINVGRNAIRRAKEIAALPEEAKAAARELGLTDNQSTLLKAAKSKDPVAVLREHATPRRHTPEAREERRAAVSSALDRVAMMLIQALGSRIAALVPDLQVITMTELVNALRGRCPEHLPAPRASTDAAENDPPRMSQMRTVQSEPDSLATITPAYIAAESTSADELVEIVRELKPNTQLRAVWWVQRGCPDPDPDENIRMTEALSEFRRAVGQASPAELDRFLDLSTAENWPQPIQAAA